MGEDYGAALSYIGSVPRLIVLLLSLMAANAGGLPARNSAAEYPAQGEARKAVIAAEYFGRSIMAPGVTIHTPKYLVVEVAVFPKLREVMNVSASHFRLRVNRSGRELGTHSAGAVAYSIRHPETESRQYVRASGGVGPGEVAIGTPSPTERFPGDPQARRRVPVPTGIPERPRHEENTPEVQAKTVEEQALVEEQFDRPVAGLLYFAWEGKTKNLKQIELVYEGPAGRVVFTLRPGR